MGISRSQKPHILSKHPLVLKGRSDVDFKWWFQGFDTPTYIYIYAYIDLIYMYIYIYISMSMYTGMYISRYF